MNMTACESVRPTPIANIREADEQCKRTAELLGRFSDLLREAGIYNPTADESVGQPSNEIPKPADNNSLSDVTSRVNRNIRVNANRLGDLLDNLQNELL